LTKAGFDAAAARWSDEAYADTASYLSHRARVVLSLGPELEPGDTLLDLACGDGALAAFLPKIRYLGVDASEEMVAAARRRGVDAVVGHLDEYEPREPVAATSVFRAIYYARDHAAFFRRVAAFTTKKLVFDLNPRQYGLGTIYDELRAAGFDTIAARPFFVPQTAALPAPGVALLRALERSGPLARLLLRVRFTYVISASRSRLPRGMTPKRTTAPS
jgi:SAM-dependent methyltransferase